MTTRTSGNPAKKAAAKKTAAKKTAARATTASKASDFKRRAAGVTLTLPSGLAVRAKRVDLQVMLAQGTIPNPLIEVVSEALERGQQMDPKELVGDKVNLDKVAEMYELVNSVVVASVVEPRISSVPEDPEDRDDDQLYVDEVEDEDKMFIFQWAGGGTDDVATFREEARASLASLA